MNTYPSMQPEILDELGYIYNEIKLLKQKNEELGNENKMLHMLVNDQNKKIDIIHRLFNTYSKIVSENSRKLENMSDNLTDELKLLQKIKNLENELFITKLASKDMKKSDLRDVINNLVK